MSREIDALVAKEIRGWVWVDGEYGHPTEKGPFKYCACPSHGYPKTRIPNYSTDIKAACEVINRMNEDGYFINQLKATDNIAKHIALAALKAKGIEVDPT